MSKTSSVFERVPVKVQDRSGFDMSHENLFTASIGTLIPASVEEVMPGDVVSVGAACAVELPPLATNFKGRVDARIEAFFVPMRQLWAGWQDYITNDPNHKQAIPGWSAATSVPKVMVGYNRSGPGSLADYLGCKKITSGATAAELNALPFLGYQKIVDDWYRDSKVQKPFFFDGLTSLSDGNYYAAGSPYIRSTGYLGTTSTATTTNGNMSGWNGRALTELAQRNFAKDYYTTMTYQPEAGGEAELKFDVATSAGTTPGEYLGEGHFSIASLRAANALSNWLIKNNIAGTRYYDQILAHYGVLPSDAVFQRSVLLGAETIPVVCNSIAQQGPNNMTLSGTGATSTSGASYISTKNLQKNPYTQSIGAQYGKANGFGKNRLINNFEVKEHGYIFIVFSLVPHAYYSTGCRRYLFARGTNDTWAFPEFAGIGDQEVYKAELWSPDLLTDDENVIGYAQRFSEYKFHDDEIHGLLRDGESLQSFVLQRGFDSGVTLSSDLLQIPTTYMDDVMVATLGISGFNAIVDMYIDAKYLRPLPHYSLPSLCDGVQKGKTISVPKGGIRL